MSNVKIPAFAEAASRRQANDKGMSKPKIKMLKRPRNRKIYYLTYVYFRHFGIWALDLT
jgi:hypothetical protein